ncbi:MAG TPA: hypothetical protein P5528_06045 [Steroidobacteraceae bacterium]|nr:hypothetical protein [Steroidobacteraceae bacterium]HRX88991.1 hypothetical protein [Steroidobacteraceae bacterium]
MRYLLTGAFATCVSVAFLAGVSLGAGNAGAKILVFWVHTTGQPWRYLEDEKQAPQDASRR